MPHFDAPQKGDAVGYFFTLSIRHPERSVEDPESSGKDLPLRPCAACPDVYRGPPGPGITGAAWVHA